MSEEIGAGRAGDDDAGRRNDDISAADERALTALFASLVADAEPSELSPLQVQRLAATAANRRSLSRNKQIKTARNVLVAAAVAAAVLLTLPALLRSSSSPTAGSAVNSAAAASSAAGSAGAGPRSQYGAASSAASAAAAPAQAPHAATPAVPGPTLKDGTEAGSGSATSASSQASAPSSGPASSGAASAASSAAATSSAASGSAASGSTGCPPLPKAAVIAVSKALSADYRGAAVRIQGCSVVIAASSEHPRIALVVAGSAPGVCEAQGSCTSTDNSDAFVGRSGSGTALYVYGKGVVVTIRPAPGQPDREALVALARALVGALPTP